MRVLWILPLIAASAFGQPSVEGTLRVGIFNKLDGVEKYAMHRTADGYELQSHFEFSDRGNKMPLDLTLQTTGDFTPRSFRLTGKLDASTSVDTAVRVSGQSASVQEGDRANVTTSVTSPFFVRSGFRPAALQMLLVRYWQAHGRPARIALLPAGEARVSRSGSDVVEVNGKATKLDRFQIHVAGEDDVTVWLDGQQSLAAAVIDAAGASSIEVVRDDLLSSVATFTARAESAAIANMREMTAVKPLASGKIALAHATLIDVASGATTPDSVVLVAAGRIEYAGVRRAIPRGYKTLDLTGKTLMPGLWDMHAHFEQPVWAPIYLASGVTTVRDVGNKPDFELAVRSAIENNEARGPRMLLAGIIDGSGPNAIGAVVVSNEEEARAAVETYARRRFDQIKVYASITPEELSAITTAAHKLGLTVTGHVPVTMSTDDALSRGLDQVNHVTTLLRGLLFDVIKAEKLSFRRALAERFDPDGPAADALIAQLKQRGIVFDPTIALFEFTWRPSADPLERLYPDARRLPAAMFDQLQKAGVGPDAADASQRGIAKMKRFLQRVHEAGIPIVAGTDVGVTGFALARELELYVEAGMSPLEALQSATIVPARVMNRERDLATLQPGAAADLIVIDGNPLASISDIRRVEKVMSRGVLFETDGLWNAAGFAPRRRDPL